MTESEVNLQYFVPVGQLEYDDIIQTLRTENIEVVVKMYDLHSKSSFVTSEKPDRLAITKKVPYNYESLDILCSFEVDDDRYFFRTRASSEQNVFILKFPAEICKLQRRNDFRITVPASIQTAVKIEGHPNLKVEVRDLSLGGCQLAFKSHEALKVPEDQFVRISVKILEFEESKMDCDVRFSKYIPETKTALLGLKFRDISSEQTTQLQNTLIQIDRILRGKNID